MIASLAVKAIFVALAPLGLVTLVLAVAADMGMSLLVTLNGLRLPATALDGPRPPRRDDADRRVQRRLLLLSRPR